MLQKELLRQEEGHTDRGREIEKNTTFHNPHFKTKKRGGVVHFKCIFACLKNKKLSIFRMKRFLITTLSILLLAVVFIPSSVFALSTWAEVQPAGNIDNGWRAVASSYMAHIL